MIYRVAKDGDGYELIEGWADPRSIWDDILRTTVGTVPSPSLYEITDGSQDVQRYVIKYEQEKRAALTTLSLVYGAHSEMELMIEILCDRYGFRKIAFTTSR